MLIKRIFMVAMSFIVATTFLASCSGPEQPLGEDDACEEAVVETEIQTELVAFQKKNKKPAKTKKKKKKSDGEDCD